VACGWQSQCSTYIWNRDGRGCRGLSSDVVRITWSDHMQQNSTELWLHLKGQRVCERIEWRGRHTYINVIIGNASSSKSLIGVWDYERRRQKGQ
jgi:hypothetical protein